MLSAEGAAAATGAPGGGGAWAWPIAGALPSNSRMTSETAVARLTMSGSSREDETGDGCVEFTSLFPRVRPDERLYACPRVGGVLGKLGVLPVEEAVRRAGVDLHVVRDVVLLEGGVELLDIGRRDAL